MRFPRKDELKEEDRGDYRRSRGGSGAFPLYSDQELVRFRTVHGPPGELSIRFQVARPGCRGKAGREATPHQPGETRRSQVPSEDLHSSRRGGSPTTGFRECVRRRNSTTFASVRECLVPCHSMRSPKNHRRSISINAGRNYRIKFNFNFNLS